MQPAPVPPYLAGREEQIAALTEAVRSVQIGASIVVQLLGDPGTGKTALLQHAGRIGEGIGGTVLTGGGDPFSPRQRHSVFRTMPRPAVDIATPADAFRSVVDWLSAPRTPRLLLLDDVHWADRASTELLGRLVRSSLPGLLVVLAYRPRQCPPLLRERLAHVAGGRRLQLSPLSRTALASLVEATGVGVEPEDTEGNPRLALTAAAAAAGRSAPEWLTEAATLAAAQLRTELCAVPRRHHRCLAAAAVLTHGRGAVGRPATFAVAELAELTEGDGPGHRTSAVRSIDALVAADLLRASPVGRVRFRDPLVARVAYDRLGPGVRWQLHTDAARLLRSRGYPVADRAEHVWLSAAHGDTSAATELLQAGRLVAARTPERSAELLRRGLSLLAPDTTLATEIRLELAASMVIGGRLADARATLEPPPDGPAQPRAVVVRARCDRLLERPGDALAVLRARLAEQVDSARRAMLLTEAVFAAILCGAPDIDELDAAALASAADNGDTHVRTRSVAVHALACLVAGRIGPARAALAAAVAELDRMPDARVAADPDPALIVAFGELLLERDEPAIRHFDRAARALDAAGRRDVLPQLLVGHGYVALRQGRLGAAASRLQRAARLVAESTRHRLRTVVNALLSAALVERDAAAAALSRAAAAATQLPAVHTTWYEALPHRLLVQARRHAGQRTNLSPAHCGGDQLASVVPPQASYWAAWLFHAAAERGDDDGARRWLTECHRRADQLGLTGMSAQAQLAESHWLHRRGQAMAALDAARIAAHRFDRLGWRPDEAKAHLFAATVAASGERWQDADDHLRTARLRAGEIGSARLHTLVIDAQRRINGMAGRAGGPAGPRLTRREREVAELVRTGASNAQIADRLSVTVKTVETHLTHVYHKLGARSRAHLVALLHDQR